MQLKWQLQKLFDFAVNGLHHKAKAVVGYGSAGAYRMAHQGQEAVLQAAGESVHVQLFFGLSAHFRDDLYPAA